VGGSLVTVRTPRRGEPPPPPKGTAKREAITEWSAKSRMALKIALAKLKRDALGQAVFLTLTYPGEFPAPDDHAVYKNHLRVFNQALPVCPMESTDLTDREGIGNNATARLIVDADRFRADVERARGLGLFGQPLPSGGRGSRSSSSGSTSGADFRISSSCSALPRDARRRT
jgi:hypothetical protein